MSGEYPWIPIGPHQIRFEPPDTARFVAVGYFKPDEARKYLKTIYDFADNHGHFYLLLDCERGTSGMPPEGRKILTDVPRPYPFHGIIGYNASFGMRVITTTVIKAGRLLFPDKFPFPLAFFATEQEAIAQRDAWRSERAAKK